MTNFEQYIQIYVIRSNFTTNKTTRRPNTKFHLPIIKKLHNPTKRRNSKQDDMEKISLQNVAVAYYWNVSGPQGVDWQK
jgi:hypothetical protein